MTRPRRNGNDTPFGAWVRKHPQLPSQGASGYVTCDTDYVWHQHSRASFGRTVQDIMDIEEKTHNDLPSPSQLDTLWKRGLFRGIRSAGGNLIYYHGAFILTMAGGDTPENCRHLTWSIFDNESPEPRVCPITASELIKILRFEWDPRTMALINGDQRDLPEHPLSLATKKPTSGDGAV